MFNTPNKNYAYNYTNFSKITTQNPNFDEIKDFPKFDNPISKNAAALKNINEVPDFIQQEYEESKIPALYDNLNVVSPEEIESWKNNPIGIVEAWQKNRKFQSLIPYVNSTIDASNSIKAAFIADKVRKGEELTDEQYEVLYDYLHDMKELETRGFTFGGGTVNAVLQSIPYAEEFAIGLMTSAGGVGFASLAQTLTKIGAKKAAQKAIKEEIKNLATKSTMTGVKKKISGETTKKIYQNSMKLPTSQLLKEVGTKEVLKQTGKALPRIVGTSALFSVTKTPQAFLGNLADRQLTTGIYVTDEGDAVFGTPENVALSCMKALGSTTFDTMTETVGWTFAPLIKYFAKPVQKVMPKSFFTSFEKLISSRYGKPASEILHKYGYDGVLEEMGEELLNRFLCQTFGLNDGEYTFDSFMNNVFYKDNPTQWVQEALAFALTGGFAHGVAGSASKIHDEYKKAKQKEFYEKNAGKIGNATSETVNGVSISVPQLQGHVSYLNNSDSQTHNRVEFTYTPEEFYLDQGFIKIKGSESQAKHELRLELAKNGILKTEADDYLTTLTETEAREELKAYRQYGNISSSVNDEIKKNKEYAQAHEKMYKENIKNGMSENFAKKSADIGMFFVNNLAEKLDVSISDALTLNPEVIKTNKRIVFDDNRAKKVATARKQSEVADFFSNPDEVDSYLLNRLSAEELETLTPEQRKELAVDFAMADYNITDFDSDVQALKDSSDVVPFKLSDENIDLLTENFSTASEEEKLALSSAFDGKATPEEIELLKNSEQNQSETVQKLLQQIIDNQKGIVLYQKGNTYFQTVSSLVGMQYYNTDGSKVVNILNPLDYDYIVNISTGEKIKIEMNDDINVDEIQPQKISSDLPFEVSKKPSDNKKNLIDKLGVKDGKNIQITNINTNETVKINKGTIEKSLSNVNVNNEHYNDFCKIVYNTEFLFKTSQNILSYSDAKINKPTKISRYANIAKIDNKNYLIEFTTKDNGQITLYSVNLLNKETVLPNAYTSKNFSAPNTVNYSISHIQNVFKSKLVEKYNNDYQTAKKNFKKWFGDSKVVDENGQPLVVYHGSPSHDITTFDSSKTLYGEVSKGFNFFTNKKSAYQDSADDYANFAGTNGYRRNGKVYETYLKIQKPLHIKYTSNAMSLYKGDKQYSTPVEYYDTNYKEIKEKYNNGNYDGIIIENTDKNNDDSIIYLVPNSEQIKSVDNRGTFDESDPNIFYQSAYHGTPHRFDEFSTEHIGSGEGAQAHGWGLYFASDKKVSEDYRKTLSDTIGIGTEILVDNVTYKKIATNTYKKKENIYDSVDDYLNKALNFIETQGSKKKALKYVQEQIDNHKDAGYFDDAVYYIRIKDALNEIIKAKITKYADDYGQLYEVDIPEDDVLLDEDKTISKQPQKVQEKIEKIYQDAVHGPVKMNLEYNLNNTNGRQYYQMLSNALGSDEQASKLLNKYGIKGIKYNGRQDGECYVIFDDNAVDVLKTYYQTANKNVDDSLKYKNLPQELKDAVDYIYNGQSVYDVTGEEFPDNGGNFTSLLNRVADFYKNNFSSKVKIENFGEVLLDKKSVKNSSYHNFNENKVNAFAAVPYVLQNGKIANYNENYNGKNEDRYLFVAPITIKGDEYFCEVVVKATDRLNKSGVKRFYLHEVELKEKLDDVFLTPYGRTSSSSKSIIADLINKFNPADNTVYQSKNTARGFYQLDKNLITILKDGNVDTVIHEYAHWYLNTLASLEGSSQKVDDALADIRKFLKNDGSKFSEKQHEKFAKACEKYFYSGYAKNNKLKAIFEDIKNILHSVYDKLFDKDGNPYFAEFTEEDNKHIKELFDDIFAAEKNRVKNVVFDKVNKLEQMISDIKTKENQELAEIEKIRSGIEAEIKESGEIKKDVQALIDDSAKYADRKQNARWKDYNENRQKIAYDIIATAVGIPVKELKQKLHSKNEKTREDIELKIREVSDKLDVMGYAERPEIKEFFGSIYFDEIGANQKLVDMAMQAIDSKVDFDSELDKELNFFMNRFDYLNNKLQKTKGKQAAYISEAMLQVFTDIRLDSLPEWFVTELGEKIMQAVEKNDLKDYRNASHAASDLYQGLILQKLKQIKLYSPKDGYAIRIDRFHALYAELPYATNAINTIKIIKKINRLIIDDIRQRQKGLIAKEISRQIKINSKIITTKFGNRKGKFDWKTNSVFYELESLNRVNLQELEKEYDDLASEADCILLNTDNGFCNDLTDVKENSTVEFSFDKCLKKKFIEYKRSKSLKDVDVQLLLSLLSDIIELKEKGRTSKNKEELEKRLQRYDLRNDLSQRIKNNSKLQNYLIKWAATNDSTLNLNFILRLCFGEDTVDKYSLDQEETEAQIYARRHLMSFYNNALRIYKIKSPTKIAKSLWDINGINKLQKMFREYEKEGYRVLEHLYDYKTKEEKVDEIIINRAEIITLYAWDQNPLLHKRLINQFGKVQLDDLFAKLSPQDQMFALKMIEECDSMFEDTNEVMIRSQGLALEKVENYFPSIVKRHGDAIDNSVLLNVRIGKPSVTKKRVKSEHIAMNPKNPLSIFGSHVDKVASYVCVSEKASFVSEIIGTPDLARAFETRFNKDYEIAKKSKSKAIKSKRTTDGAIIYKKIAEQVAASTFFKYAQSVNTLNKLSKTIADNFIVQAIGWSPKIAFGQLLSVINYADGSDITIAEWIVGFARAIADPKKTFEFMLQDEYLQARFYGNLQNETMQALLNDFDKWKSVKTFFTTNIRYGDIIAICMGGRPYVEHLMSQGFTKEEAFRRFRRKTNEAQQSSLPSTISNYQRLSQSSFLNKVFLAFKNTDHQYERKFLEALSGLIRGDVPKSAAIKSILLYRVVNPLLFSWILNQLGLWTLLFGDDDDKIASLKGAGLALLSVNLGAYGLLGVSLATLLSMANRILSGKGGLYKTEIPLISDIEENSARIMSDIKNGELRTETLVGCIAMTLGLGAGAPAQKIYNTGSGIYDITNGEVAVGIAKMLGWSDSVARKTFDD